MLYYKGDISALVLFAQNDSGSVCFPKALPDLSSPLERDRLPGEKINLHPTQLLNHLNQQLNLDNDLLKMESGFSEAIDCPNGPITVHLARFMVLDPPHALLQTRSCRLKTLPELRRQPPAEMELLRRVYVKVMEG